MIGQAEFVVFALGSNVGPYNLENPDTFSAKIQEIITEFNRLSPNTPCVWITPPDCAI